MDISSHQPQPNPEIQRFENGQEYQVSMQWQWSWSIFVRKGLTKLHQCTSLCNKNIDWWLHHARLPALLTLSSSPLVSTMSQCPNTIAGVCLLGPIYQSAGQGRGRGGRGTVSHLPVTHPTAAPGSLTPPGVETRPGQVQKYEGGECLY